MKRVKSMTAWADVGSHGGIFEFAVGPVGDRYPYLLHIFSKPLDPHLVKVRITPVVKTIRKRKRKN